MRFLFCSSFRTGNQLVCSFQTGRCANRRFRSKQSSCVRIRHEQKLQKQTEGWIQRGAVCVCVCPHQVCVSSPWSFSLSSPIDYFILIWPGSSTLTHTLTHTHRAWFTWFSQALTRGTQGYIVNTHGRTHPSTHTCKAHILYLLKGQTSPWRTHKTRARSSNSRQRLFARARWLSGRKSCEFA